ncbi:LOW QUALITY PROTEIN: hypothetical protein MXB_5421 [Myxobolus squamalis]|nr:LOW QUALITY PROTEIN: hypothetical protein MXB_5421 [Myxobolus squamalis]
MYFIAMNSETQPFGDRISSDINLSGIKFLILYSLIALPFIFSPNFIGNKWTIIAGCCFNLIGSLLRLSYIVSSDIFNKTRNIDLVVGTLCYSCSMGLLFSIPTLISAVWFKVEQRPITTSISYMAYFIGVGFGMIDIDFLAISKSFKYNIKSFVKIKSYQPDINNYLICIAIWGFVLNIVLFIFSIFLMKEMPPTPPRRSMWAQLDLSKSKGILVRMRSIKNSFFNAICVYDYRVAIMIFSTIAAY